MCLPPVTTLTHISLYHAISSAIGFANSLLDQTFVTLFIELFYCHFFFQETRV